MTHSLHRLGTTKNLKNDLVLIVTPAKGINDQKAVPKLRKLLKIIKKYDPVHYGDDRLGNKYMINTEEYLKKIQGITNIHAVFDDKKKVHRALKEIDNADLGLSVVLSGLFDEVKECCRGTRAEFHTVEHSLGIWGQTEKLPEEPILEITTMCGHGLISPSLVKVMVDNIKHHNLSSSEAAHNLAKLCLCGIFNTHRAERLLKLIAKQ